MLGHNGGPPLTLTAELLRQSDVFVKLADAIDAAGGQKAWAERHGIAPQHLNDVLNARREISDRVLRALGLQRVTRYAQVSISRAPAPVVGEAAHVG